jgi:hypothetical protein
MRRAVVGGSLLALALMSNRLEAANAGEGSLTAAEAKRLAQCQTNQVTIVEAPEGCGVRFEVARFGAAESGFQMQYAKPPQWLADGAPGSVFWPAPDTAYHRYPQQTEGAFQPRPNGSLRVRVLSFTRQEAGGGPSQKSASKRSGVACMARVNRVTSEDRVVLNFFAEADDQRPNAIAQVFFESAGPGQTCRPSR